ncbi:MAG: D-aminoacyl-tRNA deacylase [Halodesulfurarchaeum sp.]
MIGIVVSTADEASVNIGEELRSIERWETVEEGVFRRDGFELREFEDLHLNLTGVASSFSDPEYVVVASRHSGETGPLLSAHFTGNFGNAEYGGSDRELSTPCPGALSRVLEALDANAPPEYDVCMECTHHGPTDFGTPGLFVELGSGEEQWRDRAGARAVAKSILELEDVGPETDRTLVGFGGNHYASKATRIVRETEFGMGHVAADWSLDAMGDPVDNRDLLESMFEKSTATCAVLDGDYPELEAVIRELGYRIVGERWVRETSGVDPSLLSDLEVALGSVGDGLRFGDVDPDGGSFLVIDLPKELIEECQGIDRGATLDAIAKSTIAFQTRENGNRVGERAAVGDREAYDRFVESCLSILEREYEVVRREGETIHAERSTFDPDRAADLGVPEGPKFGMLASGEPVSVDGETIYPEEVETRENRQFSV